MLTESQNYHSDQDSVSFRSLILMMALYVSLIAWMIVGLIVLILPRSFVTELARAWSRFFSVALSRHRRPSS